YVWRWIRSLNAVPKLIILERCSSQDLDEAERAWIACLRLYRCRLTNHTDGGTSGQSHSIETRQKMRAAKLGTKWTAEQRAIIAAKAKERYANESPEERKA